MKLNKKILTSKWQQLLNNYEVFVIVYHFAGIGDVILKIFAGRDTAQL